jgi:hypothetical protein
MQDPSPAKLYATAVGALLLIGGIVGFFYSASFGSPGEVDEMLGAFAVNGWLNLLYILAGALGLLLAGFAPRRYAFWLGLLFLVAALWGFALGPGTAILGVFPVNGGTNLLHLALGLLGIGAALGTERTGEASSGGAKSPQPRAEKARDKPGGLKKARGRKSREKPLNAPSEA